MQWCIYDIRYFLLMLHIVNIKPFDVDVNVNIDVDLERFYFSLGLYACLIYTLYNVLTCYVIHYFAVTCCSLRLYPEIIYIYKWFSNFFMPQIPRSHDN